MNPKLKKIIACILVILGCWLILDGVGSIIIYWHQSLQEHAIRVVRTMVGVGLIVLARMVV